MTRETDLLDNFSFRRSLTSYNASAEHGASLQRDVENSSKALAFGQHLDGTGFRLRTVSKIMAYTFFNSDESRLEHYINFNEYDRDHLPPTNLTLRARDVARWNMAWRAVQMCDLVEHTDEAGVRRSQRLGVEDLLRLLTERCKNWPDFNDIFDLPIAFGFSVTGFIYGGLHALAWAAHFNSNTEQLLWRSSACIVMGGFPIIAVVFLVFLSSVNANKTVRAGPNLKRWIQLVIGFVAELGWVLLLVFLIFLLIAVIAAYMLARAYLVVECFINIFHLPAGAYDVPRWSAYFPHIS